MYNYRLICIYLYSVIDCWIYFCIIIRYIFRSFSGIYIDIWDFLLLWGFLFLVTAIIWLFQLFRYFENRNIACLSIYLAAITVNAPRRPQSRVQTAPYFSRVLLFKREFCARKNAANVSRKCQTFVKTFALIARYRCTPVWASFVYDSRELPGCGFQLCIFHVNFSPKCSEGAIYAIYSPGMCMSSFCN